jgi:magnesium-transporting ATPase (P-type)
MVTGDNHVTAGAVARKLGIDFEADVLPDKKSSDCDCRGCHEFQFRFGDHQCAAAEICKALALC